MSDALVLTQSTPQSGPLHDSPSEILCNLPNVVGAVCQLKNLGEKAVSSASSSIVDDIANAFGRAFGNAIRIAMTWWVSLPSPELASTAGDPGPVLASIQGYTGGLQVLLMIAGILFGAARLAMAKRGGVAGEAQESFLVLARAVFASMMFSALITMGTKAGDAFSNWVIFDATRGDLNSAVARLADFDLRHNLELGSALFLLLFVLGLISMLAQLVMLVVRQAVLILVVAAFPLAASAAGTGPGSQAFKRMLSWALALMLWKPVGALVYAIAFTAAGTKSSDQQNAQLVLLGLLLLLSVPIVLPALMRLITPAVSTLGGGGGAAAALAGGAFGVAMGSIGGGDSNARKVSEGENNSSGGQGPSGGGDSPPPGGGGGGGGGRPMPGGSGDSGGGGGGSGSGGSPTGSGGSAPSTAGQATAAGEGSGAAAAGGGAAAAGPAGVVVAGAEAAKQVAQQGASAVDGKFREATEAGWDVDAPSPMEVRR